MKNSTRGFTLLEIIIYIAISSFIVLSAVSLILTTIETYHYINDQSLAELEGIYWLQQFENNFKTFSTSSTSPSLRNLTFQQSTTTISLSFDIDKEHFSDIISYSNF